MSGVVPERSRVSMSAYRPDPLAVEIVGDSNGDSTVVVRGEMDIASDHLVREAILEVARGTGQVTLDMTGVEFCGSSGIAVLVEASRLLGRSRMRLLASPELRRTLELSGLTELIDGP